MQDRIGCYEVCCSNTRTDRFDNKPGKYRSIADGFFVFLEPLLPGKHDLQLSTSVSNPVDSQYNYATESLYHLLIGPSAQNQTAGTNMTIGRQNETLQVEGNQ
jgi:hypothetical protein